VLQKLFYIPEQGHRGWTTIDGTDCMPVGLYRLSQNCESPF